MKVKPMATLLTFAALLLPLAACAPKGSAAATLRYLTSAQVNGRMYGTQGNEKASEYLAAQLNAVGVLPLEKEYAVPFTANLPADIAHSVTIKAADGDIALKPAEHFTPLVARAFAAQGVLQEAEEAKLAAVDENGITVIAIEEFIGKSNVNFYDTPIKTLYVTPDGMKLLRAHLGEVLAYTCTPGADEIVLDNIFGVKKGADSTKAIVVGAHFDDTNAADGTTQGALDNGSGVAALLEAARLLQQASLPCDIVYVLWNAEEVNRTGSKLGKAVLDGRYETYCYLNIDCIGLKGGGDIEVYTATGKSEFADFLAAEIAAKGYTAIGGADVRASSDHMSFADRPHVTFTQPYEGMPLHTPGDALDKLSAADINAFAAALASTLQQSTAEILQRCVPDPGLQTPETEKATLRATLAVDEITFIVTGGSAEAIESDAATHFESLEAFSQLYPDVALAQSMGAYTLKMVELSHAFPPDTRPEKPVAGKVYKRQFSAADAFQICAVYGNEAGEAIAYTLYPGVDVKSLATAYPAKQAVDTMENAWVADSGDGQLTFLSGTEQAAYAIQAGSHAVMDGEMFFFVNKLDGSYATQEDLLAAAKTAAAAQPIIAFKK